MMRTRTKLVESRLFLNNFVIEVDEFLVIFYKGSGVHIEIFATDEI